MFNSNWLREEYNNNRLMVVVSNKKRKDGHIVHLLRKDIRRNEWYEISKKTGKEIRNYYCWWQVEDWIEEGSYRKIDIKNESVNNYFWRDWFLMELIDAVREVK